MESKKLTERQERFVENYVDTGNAAESARLSGYSEKTAKEIGHRQLQNPAVRAAITERMDQMGLTEPRLLKTLSEGLEANVVKVFNPTTTFVSHLLEIEGNDEICQNKANSMNAMS